MWHNHAMRFLIGLAIGGGIGYILGTRDGRERYDEIVAGLSDLIGEENVAQMTEFMDQGTSEIRKAANEGLDTASEVIASDDGDGATDTEDE